MAKNVAIVALIVITLVLAGVAVTQYTAQQDAETRAQNAQTAQADSAAAQATSAAQADAALSAQQTAEAAQGTAVALAAMAAQAQAEAEAGRETAVAQAAAADEALAAREADVAVTQTRVAADATMLAQNGTAVGVAAATITAQAAELRGAVAALGTATAQVDLADLARIAAEDDRTAALAQARAAATLLAQAQATIAAGLPVTATLIPSLTPAASATPTELVNAVTATPQPSEAVVIVDGVALDQVFVSADGTLRLNYPEGWLVQESENQIFLVNTPAVLDNTSEQIQPGHFLANIVFGTTSDLPGLAPDAGAVEFLTALTAIINAQASSTDQLGAASATTAGSYDAARARGQTVNGETLVVVAQVADGFFAVGFGRSAAGEADQHEAIFRAILGTLTLAP